MPRLNLLGRPQVITLEGTVDLRLNTPISLLLYLAMRNDWVSRSELAFLYRSDSDEISALAYFRKLLFRAKKYPWAESLEVSTTHLRWQVETDVKSFREALLTQDWQKTLSLYKGNFLADLELPGAPTYNAWLDLERADLLRELNNARRKQLVLYIKSEPVKALHLVGKLRKDDPFDEDLLQCQLNLLVKVKREKDAFLIYKEFVEQLKHELATEPLESTQALIDSFQNRQSQSSPESHISYLLPVPTTRFVGREKELKALHDTLSREECRLVTIVGLGGTGKTRLSLAYAHKHLSSYKDGVYFVPLAAVNHDAIIPAIASQLRLNLAGSGDPKSQLIKFLESKDLLLILDNYEYLLDSKFLLETLLTELPKLSILITSREILGTASEWLFDLGGLEYPLNKEASEAFDAVDLFVKRAVRVSNDFVVSPESLKSVAEICRLVGGMPLAIELAASWIRSLTVHQLLTELKANVDILSATADTQDKSAGAVFDYVWQHLSPSEQTVFLGLCVFQGGFDLESAKAVPGADLSLVMGLINRSLVKRNAAGRYTIHELIRQYTLLNQDSTRFQHSHANYFLRLLAACEKDIQGANQTLAIQRIDADYDNIQQAWTYALESGELALLEDSLESLYYYYYFKGYFQLAVKELSFTAQHITRNAKRLRAKLLARSGLFQRNLGDMNGAGESVRQAKNLIQGANDKFEESFILCELGKIQHLLADYPTALTLYKKAAKLAKQAGNTFVEASSLMAIGDLTYFTKSDIEQSTQLYQQSLQLFRQIGEQDGINAALLNLGSAAFDQYDLVGAQHYYEEAYSIIKTLGQTHREGIILSNLGAIYMQQGDQAKALIHYEQSLEQRWRAIDKRGAAETLNQLAILTYINGEYAAAHKKHLEALLLFEELSDSAGIAFTKSHYARSLHASGQTLQAKITLNDALKLAWRINNQTAILSSLLSAALITEENEQAADLATVVYKEAKGSHEVIRQEAYKFLQTRQLEFSSKTLDLQASIQQLLS